MWTVLPLVATRRATVDDLDVVLGHVQAGFDSYGEFAPRGWQAPKVATDRDRSAELLGDHATWALIAFADGRSIGHVAFLPARERSAGEPRGAAKTRAVVPGLAHLWQLFVLPDWWGRDVAAMLHDAMAIEMRARDYREARLFTPSLHARARRFYERRGWSAAGEDYNEELALMLTEYHLRLRPVSLVD
jgi:GNAT superfamily N-acetyltransferase